MLLHARKPLLTLLALTAMTALTLTACPILRRQEGVPGIPEAIRASDRREPNIAQPQYVLKPIALRTIFSHLAASSSGNAVVLLLNHSVRRKTV